LKEKWLLDYGIKNYITEGIIRIIIINPIIIMKDKKVNPITTNIMKEITTNSTIEISKVKIIIITTNLELKKKILKLLSIIMLNKKEIP